MLTIRVRSSCLLEMTQDCQGWARFRSVLTDIVTRGERWFA